MKTIQGDLIALALTGHFDVIVHGCNCFCTMAAGIAKTIKQKFPEANEADLATASGDESKLGTYTTAEVFVNGKRLIIVNAYTQYNWQGSGLRIGYPAIGAGLAGGDWTIIAQIISDELVGQDHTFVEFVRNS